MSEPAHMQCPECGTELPVLQGFLTWCHECGWNVSSHDPSSESMSTIGSSANVRRTIANAVLIRRRACTIGQR